MNPKTLSMKIPFFIINKNYLTCLGKRKNQSQTTEKEGYLYCANCNEKKQYH